MVKSRYKAKLLSASIKALDMALVTVIFTNIWELANFGQLVGVYTLNRVQLSLWHVASIFIMAGLWYISFNVTGMYDFRTPDSWLRRTAKLVAACSLGAAAIIFGANVMGVPGVRGPVPIVFWSGTTLVFTVYRSALWALFHWLRTKGRNIRYLVIVGLGPRPIALWERLERARLGYKLLGFVDDGLPDSFLENDLGLPFLCPLSKFADYVSQQPVDEVLLALPMKSHYNQALKTIDICATQGIRVRLLTDLFNLPPGVDYHIERIDDFTFINYDTDAHTEAQHDLKRVLDFFLATAAVIVLSPVYLLISLAVLISDGWPIFFVQERIGLNKRRFKMYKFRTMVRNADSMQPELEAQNQMGGAAFKMENDPRVTRFGDFLRRTSLDELPQFFNVMLGNMSLVGPRPLTIRDFEKFYDDSHRRRFSAKPGITGLWQVSGRSDINFEEWMKLDSYYIDTWSFGLDFRIMLRTAWVVLGGRGAY